jgi:hypothetical protein
MYTDKPMVFLSQYMSILAYKLAEFMKRPWNTPESGWIMLGTLCALLQSQSHVAPKSMTGKHAFKEPSVNGKFILYPVEGPDNDLAFMKIAVDADADKLECDSVVMRSINKHIAAGHRCCFTRALLSSRIFVERRTNKNGVHKYHIDFDKMLNALEHGYGLTSAGPTYKDYPCIVTNAAIPGISLDEIMEIITKGLAVAMKDNSTRRPGSLFIADSVSKMSVLLRNNLFKNLYADAATTNTVHFVKARAKNIVKTLGDRIFAKLAHLFKGLLDVGQKVGFSHGDMHTGNILYDMYDDCFVVIDYGRSYVDINKAFSNENKNETVMMETMKLQTNGPTFKFLPEEFFNDGVYGSFFTRVSGQTPMLNVMSDIAGLSVVLWNNMFEIVLNSWQDTSVIQAFHEGFINFAFVSRDDDDLMVAYDLAPHIELMSTMQPTQDNAVMYALLPGLLWFCLIVHALIKTPHKPTLLKAGKHRMFNGIAMMQFEWKDVVGGDAPFYHAGQLMPEYYKEIAQTMVKLATQLDFTRHLQEWSKKTNPQYGGRVLPVRMTKDSVAFGGPTQNTKTMHASPVIKSPASKPYDYRKFPSPEVLDKIHTVYVETQKRVNDKRLSIAYAYAKIGTLV